MDWLSTSPNSEVIVDENVNTDVDGLTNKLLNVAFDVYPPVVVLPSPGLVAVISIPLVRFWRVKDPNVPLLSTESTIVLQEDVAPTIKVELIVTPEVNVISAVPNVSPTFTLAKSNEPASDVNTEEAISVSPWSWLTSILKSASCPQFRLDKLTPTVGEKFCE